MQPLTPLLRLLPWRMPAALQRRLTRALTWIPQLQQQLLRQVKLAASETMFTTLLALLALQPRARPMLSAATVSCL